MSEKYFENGVEVPKP